MIYPPLLELKVNERWEHILEYTVDQLELMQAHPEQHPLEWDIWKGAKDHVLTHPKIFYDVDWPANCLKTI